MRRKDREQARRVSDYVDGLVVHRRAAEERGGAERFESQQLRDVMALADILSTVDLPVPDGFAERLEQRLPLEAKAAPIADGGQRPVLARVFGSVRELFSRGAQLLVAVPRFVHAAAAVAVIVLVAASLLGSLLNTPAVSAAEILYRADEALGALVRPGETLYRRWRVVRRISEAPETVESIQESLVQEWMDGSDFDRVASRVNSLDGRLLWAFASAREHGELRSKLYFAPGFSNEPAGLLNIEPTSSELKRALSMLPVEDRSAVQAYIDLGYIYEPIRGEQRFNRAMLESASSEAGIPRVVLSVDRSAEIRGVPVFKVRVVHPARIRARWRSVGPPVVRMIREETVCYVLRDSYLGVKTETVSEYEDGSRTRSTRDLVETRVIRTRADVLEPFQLEGPPGTPIRRQSAFEHLSQVAKKLRQSTTALTSKEDAARVNSSR